MFEGRLGIAQYWEQLIWSDISHWWIWWIQNESKNIKWITTILQVGSDSFKGSEYFHWVALHYSLSNRTYPNMVFHVTMLFPIEFDNKQYDKVTCHIFRIEQNYFLNYGWDYLSTEYQVYFFIYRTVNLSFQEDEQCLNAKFWKW